MRRVELSFLLVLGALLDLNTVCRFQRSCRRRRFQEEEEVDQTEEKMD